MLTVREAKSITEDFALNIIHDYRDSYSYAPCIINQANSVSLKGALNKYPSIIASIRIVAEENDFVLKMNNLDGKSCNVGLRIPQAGMTKALLHVHLADVQEKFYKKLCKFFDLV